MSLELSDCQFVGPALPDPFVRFELEKELTSRKLIPKKTGDEGKHLRSRWDVYRRHLQELAASGGPLRVCNRVIEPIVELLGYKAIEAAENVTDTRRSRGGRQASSSPPTASPSYVSGPPPSTKTWTPPRSAAGPTGSATFASPSDVLLTSGERLGLLTNGVELRFLISDPADPTRRSSSRSIPAGSGTGRFPTRSCCSSPSPVPKGSRRFPRSSTRPGFSKLASPRSFANKHGRRSSGFVQEILDQPENRSWFASHADRDALARDLWHEGLITDLPALVHPQAGVERRSGADVQLRFDESLEEHVLAEHGAGAVCPGRCRERRGNRPVPRICAASLFRMFEKGLESTELMVKPLGGKLFGEAATPTLTPLHWGERAVAVLLDRLLWTSKKRGAETRDRVHYGSLDVEDLGRVYEALLELEPGISSMTMCRLRRQKLEVVVPAAQGEKYRPAGAVVASPRRSMRTLTRTNPRRRRKTKKRSRLEARRPRSSGSRRSRRTGSTCGWAWGGSRAARITRRIRSCDFWSRRRLGRRSRSAARTKIRIRWRSSSSRCSTPRWGAATSLSRLAGSWARSSTKHAVCATRRLSTPSGRPRPRRPTTAERRALEAAQEWRQRIIDLPDPDDELAKTEFVPRLQENQALEPVAGYLPSKSSLPGTRPPGAGSLPPAGGHALPLRRGQEPARRRAGEARTLARIPRARVCR